MKQIPARMTAQQEKFIASIVRALEFDECEITDFDA
jgi:hypothetical protein